MLGPGPVVGQFENPQRVDLPLSALRRRDQKAEVRLVALGRPTTTAEPRDGGSDPPTGGIP